MEYVVGQKYWFLHFGRRAFRSSDIAFADEPRVRLLECVDIRHVNNRQALSEIVFIDADGDYWYRLNTRHEFSEYCVCLNPDTKNMVREMVLAEAYMNLVLAHSMAINARNEYSQFLDKICETLSVHGVNVVQHTGEVGGEVCHVHIS